MGGIHFNFLLNDFRALTVRLPAEIRRGAACSVPAEAGRQTVPQQSLPLQKGLPAPTAGDRTKGRQPTGAQGRPPSLRQRGKEGTPGAGSVASLGTLSRCPYRAGEGRGIASCSGLSWREGRPGQGSSSPESPEVPAPTGRPTTARSTRRRLPGLVQELSSRRQEVTSHMPSRGAGAAGGRAPCLCPCPRPALASFPRRRMLRAPHGQPARPPA